MPKYEKSKDKLEVKVDYKLIKKRAYKNQGQVVNFLKWLFTYRFPLEPDDLERIQSNLVKLYADENKLKKAIIGYIKENPYFMQKLNKKKPNYYTLQTCINYAIASAITK